MIVDPADPPRHASSVAGAGGDESLLDAVVALRERLAPVAFPLKRAGDAQHDRASAELSAVLTQLDDYVVPRLRQLDAPLLAVVGGSTGAGKSTLVNSIVGSNVTASGVLRPTTRSPVLAHHPDDQRWFDGTRILPTMARTTGPSDLGGLRLVADPSIPRGLALLDAPDLDSVVIANRELATQLLAAADLWLFVTTAARYADAVPWESLRAAAERGTSLAVVLNRVPTPATAEVTHHLAEMLARQDLGAAPLFVIQEVTLTADSLLPSEVVGPVRQWLTDLAADASARTQLARQTVAGAVHSLSRRVALVAAEADRQVVAHQALAGAVDTAYVAAADRVDESCEDGSMLRGEVLARWQEFVGTGELLRGLEERLGVLRNRVVDYFKGRPPTPDQADQVAVALETGLEAMILDQADAAAEEVVSAWSALDGGTALLADDRETLARRSPELAEQAARAVRDWQGQVLDLIRTEGQGKRTTARFLSLGVNGLGVALMVVVFAHTGGLTGAEVGIAGGTAVVGQRVLEAVFGDQAVRQLTETAREALREHVQLLLQTERERFDQRLARLPVDPDVGAGLRTALRAVEAAR
jgi:hypothetical protein